MLCHSNTFGLDVLAVIKHSPKLRSEPVSFLFVACFSSNFEIVDVGERGSEDNQIGRKIDDAELKGYTNSFSMVDVGYESGGEGNQMVRMID